MHSGKVPERILKRAVRKKIMQMAQAGGEVIVVKNGKEVARLVSYDRSVSFLTDSLTGVLKGDYDEKQIRMERMGKYENTD